MKVHVVTAYGLSEWYKRVEGVVQGGAGLDPMFYIIYVQGIHIELRLRGMGTKITGATADYLMPSLGLVDDTALIHETLQGLQRLMDVAISIAKLLGQRCTTKKIALLRYAADNALLEGRARWGLAELKTKFHHHYLRLPRGNINVKGGHHQAHRELKNTCAKWKRSLYRPQPSHPVARQVIRGVALNRWIFSAHVNIPTQVRIISAVSTVSRLVKTVYHIPQKAPHCVSFGVSSIPNLEYPVRATVMADPYKALNSNNRVVKW